jgi:hypothetical protein
MSEKDTRDIEQVENGNFAPPSATDKQITADSNEDLEFKFTIWKFIAILVRIPLLQTRSSQYSFHSLFK